jgi:ribonuclease VapC
MVLDASALVAILLQEPRHERLLEKAEKAGIVAIGVPTVLEAATVLSARTSSDARARVLGLLRRMEAEIVPFTEEHFNAAMDAFLRFGKGRHPARLNFGDCMAYAVAAVSGLPLLYTGSDFSQTDIPAA